LAGMGVEGFERAAVHAVAFEVAPRVEAEEGHVPEQAGQRVAPSPYLLAGRRGWLERPVEPAQRGRVGVQLLGGGGQKALPPGGVQADVLADASGNAQPARD